MHGTIIPGTIRLPIQTGAAMPEARRITTIIPGAGEALGVGAVCTVAITHTGDGVVTAVTAGVLDFHGVAHGVGADMAAGIWAGDILGAAGTALITHTGAGVLHTDGVMAADTGAVATMHPTTEEAASTEEDSTATTEVLAINMA